MNNAFNIQILAEKLSKLNNSQQSIETLSHWCIFHRKKARQVVETWEKLFSSCQKERQVSFLYLANDILQNSRRKGSEFVNEFWKVLPKALKDVSENGDEHAKNAVIRLVDIWEERKVFGSHGRTLKDDMVGKDPPKDPPYSLDSNRKGSNSIKIVKRDAHFVRLKLAVGGIPDKILSAFQCVNDEQLNEEIALNKCKAALRHVEKVEKDVENTCAQGTQQESSLANELQELQELETNLLQCIQQFRTIEATRAQLVAQLRESLNDQESKLELVRTQVQIAQVHVDRAVNMRKRLTPQAISVAASSASPSIFQITTSAALDQADSLAASGPNEQVVHSTHSTQPLVLQPVTSSVGLNTSSEEQQKKAAAAAMAAKLAASTSSAQMLSSVLSSLVAEEAAAAIIHPSGPNSFPSAMSIFPAEKRPKLEKPMPVTDVNSTTYYPSMSQTSQQQSPYSGLPLPPVPPQSQQYLQSNGILSGVTPYGLSAGMTNSSLPQPPTITNMLLGSVRPAQQQQQQTGYYQSTSAMGFYSQNHPPATPVPPRQ